MSDSTPEELRELFDKMPILRFDNWYLVPGEDGIYVWEQRGESTAIG
jgi:hypothetical protein